MPKWRWLAPWILVLLALKFATSLWPTHKDASQWAAAIRERAAEPVHEVIFVEDMTRYGLRLHLDAEIEKLSLDPIPADSKPRFNPVYDEDLATELTETMDEPGAVWICKQSRWPEIRQRIANLGYSASVLGTPHDGRIIFKIGMDER